MANLANILRLPSADASPNIVDYALQLGSNGPPILTGRIAVQTEYAAEPKNGTAAPNATAIMAAVKALNKGKPGITYVFYVFGGTKPLVYVGKSLNTIADRYPGALPASGGMKLLTDTYDADTKAKLGMHVCIYQSGNPTLIEGLIFDKLTQVKSQLDIINLHDMN